MINCLVNYIHYISVFFYKAMRYVNSKRLLKLSFNYIAFAKVFLFYVIKKNQL